ncbi:MAG TPA: endonuclease III [Nitrospirae bacterium]|nr:endonuclease III [Nitrospirota bacterium]
MDRKKQAREIIRLLKKSIPEPKTALRFRSVFQILVAAVLSAQSTDVQVNRITKTLFRKYRSIKAFAEAPLEELQADVSSVNFYKNKARNIRNSARMIIEEFGGKVPRTMEELVRLPGVARKTANIILTDGHGITVGIAVDTHVIRLTNRLGLTTHKDPVKIEQDLLELAPEKDWPVVSHLLILHGRTVCTARKPKHDECELYKICPSRED